MKKANKEKEEVVFSRKESQEIADKIETVFTLVALLTERDISYLKEAAKKIGNEMSHRNAVAGILIPLEKSDMANALGEQALDRITGLSLIWAAIKRQPQIVREYSTRVERAREIEGMFGL